MNVTLASSLHFSHGECSPDRAPGDPLRMLDFVPMGLLCLKSYAEQQGVEADIRVCELNGLINVGRISNDEMFYDHLVDEILGRRNDLVGLMTDADSLHHTVLLARAIKQRQPTVLICLGGPAASPLGSMLLNTFPFLDFVVRSEGEETFVELLTTLRQGKALNGILGLTWRGSSGAIENPIRRLEQDLDRFPMPDFEAYDMAAGAPLYLDVGRGCPFKCQFCATAPFWRQEYRMKSIDRIIAEMVLLRDRYGRTHANFSHDIFTCDRAWTLEFCKRLTEQPIDVTWSCSTRTDIIKPDLLENMAQAGCVEIFYGIETGSPQLQEEIQKHLDLEWSKEIIVATAAAGIRPVTGFIAGYPMETRDTFRETLQRYFEFLQIGGFRAHIFALKPYHESPLFKKYGADRFDRPSQYFDLHLTGAALRDCAQMKNSHPEIFSTYFRYSTPGIQDDLIDATEEISAQLVMLHALWPHLLKYYASPLDLFERWTSWISAHNALCRPGTPYRHQSDVEDLLTFIEDEVERIGCDNSGLVALLRYERLKAAARGLAAPAKEGPVGTTITEDTVVQKGCDYLAEEFDLDLRSLLDGQHRDGSDEKKWVLVTNAGEGQLALRRWVLVAKADGANLNTYHIGARAKRLLDLTTEPARVRDLIDRAAGPEVEDSYRADYYRRLLENLVGLRLVVPVTSEMATLN